jgi:hypothetical protein
MINVYIAIIILIGVMIYGQVYADSDQILKEYYNEHIPEVSILKAETKRPNGIWNCHPYGDDDVGYFRTEEEYNNAYDPAIYAREEE